MSEFKKPSYYVGFSGNDVEHILRDFDMLKSHHKSSAIEYIIRSGKKTECPREDLEKAINHLKLELELYPKELKK